MTERSLDPRGEGRAGPRPATPGGSLLAAGALLLGLLGAVAGCGGEAGPSRFVSLGTAGTGGIYYPLGGTIASLMSTADSARQYNAEVTGGSLENVTRLRDGEIELGMSIATTVYEAYHGGTGFDSAFADLRVVAPLYPNQGHVLVPGGSDVESVADFEGGRLSVGSAGSGTEQFSRQLLAAYGLGYDDLDERFLTFTESAQALGDASIGGAVFSVGYPASAALQ
ncbi:MAG: TAXI family TRAP transporter solute-binding subunit, partial [Gemmatimonadota bacterium]